MAVAVPLVAGACRQAGRWGRAPWNEGASALSHGGTPTSASSSPGGNSFRRWSLERERERERERKRKRERAVKESSEREWVRMWVCVGERTMEVEGGEGGYHS